jgi:hypothetical protein
MLHHRQPDPDSFALADDAAVRRTNIRKRVRRSARRDSQYLDRARGYATFDRSRPHCTIPPAVSGEYFSACCRSGCAAPRRSASGSLLMAHVLPARSARCGAPRLIWASNLRHTVHQAPKFRSPRSDRAARPPTSASESQTALPPGVADLRSRDTGVGLYTCLPLSSFGTVPSPNSRVAVVMVVRVRAVVVRHRGHVVALHARHFHLAPDRARDDVGPAIRN